VGAIPVGVESASGFLEFNLLARNDSSGFHKSSMKWSRLLALPAIAPLLLACSSSTASPQNTGVKVEEPGLFTYWGPSGWDAAENAAEDGADYQMCTGPTQNEFTPKITTNEEGYQSVSARVTTYLAKLKGPDAKRRLVDQSSFETEAGAKGMRIIVTDLANPPQFESITYAFSGRAGLLLVFTCTCRPADDAQFRSLYDASMKTLVLPND
jgi:hypothetical protein